MDLLNESGGQRWREGRTTWKTPAQGYFDSSVWEVTDIAESPAKEFTVKHHYSRSYPAAKYRFGIVNKETGELGGILIYGPGVQRKTLENAFPTLEPYTESLELSRLVLLDHLEFNAESWAVAQAHRELRDRGVKGIVSFSDPVPRIAQDGTVVSPGHRGVVYASSNAILAGRGTPRTLTMLGDTTVLNDRSIQKLRAGERGAEGVYRRLRELGAPRRGDTEISKWLPVALDAVGAKKVRHPGNVRWLFKLGSAKEKRNIPIGIPGAVPTNPAGG